MRTIRIWLLVMASLWAGCVLGCAVDDDDNDDASDDDTAPADEDDDTTDDDTADDDEPTVDELLQRFRPVVIQQLAEDYAFLPYPETSDRLGELSLHPGDGEFEYTVQVDTAVPVVYTASRVVTIRQQEHLQLLYFFFYPERPIPITMADGFLEYMSMYIWSGLIDGKVVRVTLDADRETPLLIEIARNCGCDWQLYVNQKVDNAVRGEFEAAGEEYPGLVKADAPNDVHYVHLMPADLPGAATTHIAVAAEAGWTDDYPHRHLAAFTSFEQYLSSDIQFAQGDLYLSQNEEDGVFDPGPLTAVSYVLQEYEPLYTLPVVGTAEAVGIFDPFGFVWNSYSPLTNWMRKQCCFTKYPGTPRDPNELEVVHETMDFWDVTTLFDTFIYLPESLFGPA